MEQEYSSSNVSPTKTQSKYYGGDTLVIAIKSRDHLMQYLQTGQLYSSDRVGNKRAVNQYSMSGKFLRTFDSLNDASRMTNTSVCTIFNCCKGIQQSTKGFKYKYAE